MTVTECNCGCGEMTRGGNFKQGHDENVRAAVMYLLGDTMDMVRLFGFGPDGRNAKKICEEGRAA